MIFCCGSALEAQRAGTHAPLQIKQALPRCSDFAPRPAALARATFVSGSWRGWHFAPRAAAGQGLQVLGLLGSAASATLMLKPSEAPLTIAVTKSAEMNSCNTCFASSA